MNKGLGWGLAVGLLVVAGVGWYCYLDLSGKVEGILSDYASAHKANAVLDNHQMQINQVRITLGQVTADYASGQKTNHALDTIQGQLNSVRNDYASARKVDALIVELRAQIAALKTELTAARQPVPAPTHVVELGFRKGEDTAVVLRYSGTSVEDALGKMTSTKPGTTLNDAVKVSPEDPKVGTAAFNYAVLRTPIGTRTFSLGGTPPAAVGVSRNNPTGTDWDLNAPGRQTVIELLKTAWARKF